ncbi:CNT_collapsed_G0001460.mRNA.1.CDS.1 [Saccharomyces cerevisiae]|nr:CNT_collapsed_G0001460.mRNA.1.CDS.1 [Saccharomyces cerevisiae]
MSDPVELLKRAEKKGVPSSGFMKLFSGSDSYKFEEAADLCVQAATIYRLRKELNLAGDSFLKAADYQKRLVMKTKQEIPT